MWFFKISMFTLSATTLPDHYISESAFPRHIHRNWTLRLVWLRLLILLSSVFLWELPIWLEWSISGTSAGRTKRKSRFWTRRAGLRRGKHMIRWSLVFQNSLLNRNSSSTSPFSFFDFSFNSSSGTTLLANALYTSSEYIFFSVVYFTNFSRIFFSESEAEFGFAGVAE